MRIIPAVLAILILLSSVFVYTRFTEKPKKVTTGLGAILGDINTDGNVDILDFQILSNTFGKSSGQSGYDSRANLNGDTSIDILDFQILSNNFGNIGSTNSPTPISGNTPTLRPNTPTPLATVSLLPTSPGDSATIVAAGDIACGIGSGGAACKQLATSNLIGTINPTAVLLLGDNQYEEGALTDFQNFYNPSWGRFKSITKPAVGNHEYLTSGAAGYFDYFNGVGNTSGQAGDRSKGYYAYNLGYWRLYALNSQLCGGTSGHGCDRGTAQETWLRQDLAANPHLCQLAYFHHPLWTSGSRYTLSTRPLYQALYDYKVEVVLAGHEHNYERFAPMDAQGTAIANGIREIVAGTGGRNFTQFTHTEANSQVKNDATFGILKMVLNSSSYDFNFIPILGSTFTDSLTGQRCN